MEISKELLEETRKLVKQWENVPITHPSGSIITESFGVSILEDGTRIIFKSDKEREEFLKVMSTLRALKRNLNKRNVYIAKKHEEKKTELAKEVLKSVEKDSEKIKNKDEEIVTIKGNIQKFK